MEPDTERELAEIMAALKALKAQGDGAGAADPHAEAVKKLPGKGEAIKSAPAVAMICGTAIFLAIIIVFVTLTIVGRPTDELFRLMNLFLNALGAIGVLFTLGVAINHARRTMENRQIALGSARQAVRAAHSAEGAQRAVNGELTVRLAEMLKPMIHQAAEEAIRMRCEQDKGDRPPPTTTPPR